MATGISWADETWNPVVGCTPVSTGCAHCYAARTALRLDRCGVPQYRGLAQSDLIGRPAWTGAVRTVPAALQIPYHWTRPRVVFLGSMSDLFHEQVPGEFLDRIWDVIEDTDHVYLILTKRPERMRRYLDAKRELPWNAWVGTSIESPAQLHRLEPLLECRPFAGGTFLSLEPLLAPLAEPLADEAQRLPGHMGDISRFVDWVIAGGESGAGARPMQPAWPRELRDLCHQLCIPFHFKQWGPPRLGRVLDGRAWDKCPPEFVRAGLEEPPADHHRCRTCETAPVFRHNRCRLCLSRFRATLGD